MYIDIIAAADRQEWSRPDSQLTHVEPAELRDVDRSGHPVREAELERRSRRARRALDLGVERLEDPATPAVRIGHGPERQRCDGLAPPDDGPVVAGAEHAHD